MSVFRHTIELTLFLLWSMILSAQENSPEEEHVVQAVVDARIEDVAWLAGHWRGKAFNGTAEEMWMGPADTAMVGSYRYLQQGKTIFYELQTIVEDKGTLKLRLKHFNPDLSGWEDRSASSVIEFPLIRLGLKEAVFDGLSFKMLSDGSLQIYLKTEQDGQLETESFHYFRVIDDESKKPSLYLILCNCHC